MDASLFSPSWHRVAGLKPLLRAHVELRRDVQRGVAGHLLIDPSVHDVRRVNRSAAEFIGRCDGTATVEQIWERWLAAAPEEVPSQDEIVRLLISLHERGLVEFDALPDVETLFRSRNAQHTRSRRRGMNPLAFRVALFDPSRLLMRLEPIGRALFNLPMLLVWLVGVGAAAFAAALHAGELWAQGARVMNSPAHLMVAWLLYPVIKLVHELGHGLATRRFGGTVREAGITLLMLTPVPFVNASSADAFRRRRDRAIVSAAGILVELALASIAMGVWLLVEPGRVRDVAYAVMAIGGVSTVLVNANPLMRFDGYYLASDLLDLRNVSTRSARLWSQWLSLAVFGTRSRAPLKLLPGEGKWLAAYAPLAAIYRVALSLGIMLWLGHLSALLGGVLGLLMLVTMVALPIRNAWRDWASEGSPKHWVRGALIGTLVIGGIAVLPLPYSTVAQGVVWLPEQAQLRALTDGFMLDAAAADGSDVKRGDLLQTLTDPLLLGQQAALEADAKEVEVEMFRCIEAEPDKVPALRAKLEFSRDQIARNAERLARLDLRAGLDGTLVMPGQREQLGQYHKTGDLLGYVMTDAPTQIRVALPQQDADLVRAQTTRIGVRLADEQPATVHAGSLKRDMTGAVPHLPSAALGEIGGGEIAIDPSDKDGLTPLVPVVLLDVEVAGVRRERIGARATVRFDHGHETLAARALRGLRQLLLRHFNPTA